MKNKDKYKFLFKAWILRNARKINLFKKNRKSACCEFSAFVEIGNVKSKFICATVHKENSQSYGFLFRIKDKYFFQKHKWTEVNKNKPLPRVCAEMQYTLKDVSDNFFLSHNVITPEERLGLEALDISISENKWGWHG